MKLLKEEMDTKFILYNEFQLNKEFLKEVWVFYSLYDLSLAVTNDFDSAFKLKNFLINRLIEDPTDEKVYNKLKSFMSRDVSMIDKAMNILEESKEGGILMGDYKKPFMVAISVNE